MTGSAVSLSRRGVLRLRGPQAKDFLQGLVTADVHKASAERVLWSAFLTPQGKFLHEFFVVARSGELLLDCLLANLPALKERLSRYRLHAQVDIEKCVGCMGGAGFPVCREPLRIGTEVASGLVSQRCAGSSLYGSASCIFGWSGFGLPVGACRRADCSLEFPERQRCGVRPTTPRSRTCRGGLRLAPRGKQDSRGKLRPPGSHRLGKRLLHGTGSGCENTLQRTRQEATPPCGRSPCAGKRPRRTERCSFVCRDTGNGSLAIFPRPERSGCCCVLPTGKKPDGLFYPPVRKAVPVFVRTCPNGCVRDCMRNATAGLLHRSRGKTTMQDNLQTGLQDNWPDHLENNPSFGKDSPSFVGKLSASMQVFLRILVEACRDLFRAQNRPLCIRSFFVVHGRPPASEPRQDDHAR